MASVADSKIVAEANNKFGLKLQTKLWEANPNTNFVYSAFSLSTTMAMTAVGSNSSTKEEIHNVFQFPVKHELANSYKSALTLLNDASSDGIELLTANRLYVQSGFNLDPNYKELVKDSFLSEVQQLDFKNAAVSSNEINSWVEKQTKDKISNLIAAESLNDGTRMILVNAIYFKGLWEKPFEADRTRKTPFFLNETESVEVDMMNMKAKFPFGENKELQSQVLELPYQGNRLSMVIFLPNQRNGLEHLVKNIGFINHAKVLSELISRYEVYLSLPRFKIESTYQLVEPLKQLGLTKIFSQDDADFSGISIEGKLFISSVVQKAFIEVNEKGTEAAAATGMHFGLTSMPDFKEFVADHPFLFQIIDKPTNFVLFSGCVTNPNA